MGPWWTINVKCQTAGATTLVCLMASHLEHEPILKFFNSLARPPGGIHSGSEVRLINPPGAGRLACTWSTRCYVA